jgi:hypothetical protein
MLYELTDHRYEPNVVLLMMVFNDDRSWTDDVRLGYFHVPDKAESLLFSWRLVQGLRYEGSRPKPDFKPNVREILKLNESCRRQKARLAVVFFRNASLVLPGEASKPYPAESVWGNLITTVSAGLKGTGIPLLDLGEALLREHNYKELEVHPQYDGHPNEIGHRIAAEELELFLTRQGLLN